MPEISKNTLNSVVTLLTSGMSAIGTGFVIKRTDIVEAFFHSYYVVTCEHCVQDQLNIRFSNGEVLNVGRERWRRASSGDDVVALDITATMEAAGVGIGHIDVGDIVRRSEPFFGVGADLYMLGLLVDERDIGVTLPRARFGNLSAFADDRAPAEQGNGAQRPCHLADMRSRTGFSGSPVIGYLEIPGLDGTINYKNRLFGVHSAQHRERVAIFSDSEFRAIEIPSSMTRIVPAWVVAELLEADELLTEERRIRQERR